jgi:hypothetical protein
MILTALLAAGCAANNGASTMGGSYCTPPECSVDGTMFAIEITPPPTATDSARLDVATLVLDDNGFFSIQLTAPVLITGQVSVGKAGNVFGLQGSVVASRPSRIPGRPDETFQTMLDTATGKYELPVTESLPGESYTLRVLPTDASEYPPQTFTVMAQAVPGAPRMVGFDLVLDDPATLTQVNGVVTDPVGKPIPGLQVQALDPTSKQVVSTTTVTDANGSYAVRLSKSVQRLSPLAVLVTAAPTNTAPTGTPMLQLNVDISKAGATNSITADLQSPPLPTPAQFSYRVTGVSRSGAEQPVVGAQLTFVAVVNDMTSTGLAAVFQAQGQSDGDGVVTIDLVPGVGQTNRMYSVSVSPPSSSEFQAQTNLPLAVGPTPTGGYGQTITLDVRPRLSGRVIDQLSKPVMSVTVQPGPATVASALDAKSLADLNNVASTATTTDGRFTLPMDSGKYDVGLLPLATMKLPRRWLSGLTIDQDLDVGDILMPMAALVRGSIVDSNGNLLDKADVQIYAVSPSTALCPNNNPSCLSPPRLAAEATTSAGQVQVLLPAATAGLPGAL